MNKTSFWISQTFVPVYFYFDDCLGYLLVFLDLCICMLFFLLCQTPYQWYQIVITIFHIFYLLQSVVFHQPYSLCIMTSFISTLSMLFSHYYRKWLLLVTFCPKSLRLSFASLIFRTIFCNSYLVFLHLSSSILLGLLVHRYLDPQLYFISCDPKSFFASAS